MVDTEYDQEKAFQEELSKITDESIKEKLNKIKKLVVARINLEKDFKAEQNKLEAKYESQYAPLYEARNDIINGKVTVNYEDVKAILPEVKVSLNENTETGIPDYWLTCLKNSSQFGELINTKDEKILKHLTDITLEYKENGNFTLFFHFTPNEYFSHTVLTREFIMDIAHAINKIVSTKIEWANEDVNPTVAKKKKKVKSKGKGEVKTIVKLEECESFFNFFKDYNAEDLKNKEIKEDAESEEEEDTNMYIEEEYDLGIFIKDELIPYSLEYYLDIVDEEGDEEMEEDEDDMDDGEDDGEDEPKPKKKLF